jgi:hypothetical protein
MPTKVAPGPPGPQRSHRGPRWRVGLEQWRIGPQALRGYRLALRQRGISDVTTIV